jgi:hypothetical protein
MEEDLQKRWQSPIGVGSYVFISYGSPSGAEYNKNREIDSQNYNATLW